MNPPHPGRHLTLPPGTWMSRLMTLALAGGALLAWPAPSAGAEPQKPAPEKAEAALDAQGDPLPAGALARLGTLRFKHGRLIGALSLSADGKVLAAGDDANVIRVWDVASGKLLRRFEKLSAAGAAYSAALAPDGKTLAAPCSCGGGAGAREQVVLWDTATGKELRRLGEPLDFLCSRLAFSPDGKVVAAGDWQTGEVHIWDAATGKEVKAWKAHAARKELLSVAINALAFAADGKRLVTAGDDKAVRLWDAATGAEVRSFAGHTDGVGCVALSPDGKVLATGSADARLWDVTTGTELHVLAGPEHGVGAVAFAPDGKTLLTGGVDGRIRLWEVATCKALRELPGHQGYVTGVFFTPDGKRIVSGGDRIVRVRDAVTGRDVHAFAGHEDSVRGLAFSPDSKLLATAGIDRTVRLWSGPNEVRRLAVAGERGAMDVAFSPDGRVLAGANATDIYLWDAGTGKELRKWEVIKQGEGFTSGLAFAPDGKSLASGGSGALLRLWDPATGKELRRFDGSGRSFSLAFAPDGKRLVTGGVSGQAVSLQVWDNVSGKELGSLPDSDGMGAAAFSPGGTLLAAHDVDHTVRLWDVARRTVMRSWKTDDGGPPVSGPLTFSRDGRMLVTGSLAPIAGKAWDGVPTVRVWEVLTGQERCSFRGHDGWILAVAVSPDGRAIASASEDTTVLLWDLAGGGPAGVLTAKETADLWSDLAAEDAARAFRAVQRLARSPEQAVALLKEKVIPARPADPKRVARLIADLDSEEFATREKAAKELQELGGACEPELRQALKDSPSAEARQRLKGLIQALEAQTLEGRPPERLRVARALEVLERVGTPKAREALKGLAEGAPGVWLTREARAALERLSR